MAQLDFPATPSNGQQFTSGGTIWTWDGAKWVAGATTSAFAPVNSPVFTGDPQAPQPVVGDSDQSIATTAFVTNAVATSLHDVGRNYCHNSQFLIQQRGGSPWTAGGIYTADRWFVAFSGGSTSVQLASMTDAVRTAIGDEAATMQFVHAVVGTAAAADFYQFRQPIEDVRRLAGKTVIVSFWCSANTGTPKVGVNLYQNMGTGGTPTGGGHGPGQSVTVSPTWTRYSLTFTVPTTIGFGIGTNNDSATNLNFWLSAGANSSAPSGNVGVQSNTFSFWGVQLEIGTVATPLEKLDPVTQLQQCQRFYCTGTVLLTGYATAGTNVGQTITLPVWMRATPAWAQSSNSDVNVSSPSSVATSPQNVWVNGSATATGTFTINRNWTATADL